MSAVAEWLASRESPPPERLSRRVREALAAAGVEDRDAFEACLAAGERLLAGVLRDGTMTRAHAFDLLAADALVTYALEAAAEDPARLEARAEQAMVRLAAVAASPPE